MHDCVVDACCQLLSEACIVPDVHWFSAGLYSAIHPTARSQRLLRSIHKICESVIMPVVCNGRWLLAGCILACHTVFCIDPCRPTGVQQQPTAATTGVLQESPTATVVDADLQLVCHKIDSFVKLVLRGQAGAAALAQRLNDEAVQLPVEHAGADQLPLLLACGDLATGGDVKHNSGLTVCRIARAWCLKQWNLVALADRACG